MVYYQGGNRGDVPPKCINHVHQSKVIKSIDILNHTMVPKHEIISREEKKELLERFNIKKEQLPIVLVSDAVIKKLGAKLGDVVRITRKSATAGQHMYYRMVTE